MREFDELVEEAQQCKTCPRLADRTAVLSHQNGSLTPLVLFIAEAPGRQGADRTRIPMHGDRSGETFSRLMESINLTRQDIFITNAVLCSPRSATGANSSPTRAEIANCTGYLTRTIDLLKPKLVVTLGATALAAISRIEAHSLTLARDVGSCVVWRGLMLIPVYHPSPQVTISVRPEAKQRDDWQAIRIALDQLLP